MYFSLEGERWQEESATHEPRQDRVSEHARVVRVPLQNRTARHLMMRLKFQHEWILISEITFKSSKSDPYFLYFLIYMCSEIYKHANNLFNLQHRRFNSLTFE